MGLQGDTVSRKVSINNVALEQSQIHPLTYRNAFTPFALRLLVGVPDMQIIVPQCNKRKDEESTSIYNIIF
jgi:hypothetical protein